jgi:serine/threonine-protein kinase
MSNVSIRKKHNGGFDGHSTIKHDYETKTIEGDKAVIDHATGLMWHQSGSDQCMEWNKARDWVCGLNDMGYAGCNDWELPTVEEAISLLESSKRNDKPYVASVFDNKQKWIWTGDRYDSGEV